jgi:hypothetical protein
MKGLLDVAKVLNLEVQLQTVAVHPLKTFCERFAFEAVQSYRPNVIFVSQCVFKSQQVVTFTRLHSIMPREVYYSTL